MRKVFILYILSKVYVNVLLRILENTVLEKLWNKRREKNHLASVDLKAVDLSFQKGFYTIFDKYDVCHNCINHCCHSKVNRFDFVDCYLNNFPLKGGVSPWHRIPHLLLGVTDVYQKMFKLHQDNLPKENCTYLSASSGCLLPVGYRPSMCVAGTCYKLLEAFSNEDLRQYSSLLSKYSIFHAKCFFQLLREINGP